LARGALLVVATIAIAALAGWGRHVRASDDTVLPSYEVLSRGVRSLWSDVESVRGELATTRLELERANSILHYSEEYQIPADLTAAIYDIALSEGITPDIGFRLVRVESGFKQQAVSGVGALGYTQLRLATARFYEPTLEREDLFNREVNLRLGFRFLFLKDLMQVFDDDFHYALLAYNRGPARVREILAAGGNPANGYAAAILGRPR
jgi:soluble lytic murein transglycosylase-like protein